MKILLVHADKTPWATQRRAEALKKEWEGDVVDVAYYKDLPDGDLYDVIHFLFSGGIGKCKEYIKKNRSKVFTTLASQRTLDEYFDTLDDLKEIYTETVHCVCQNKELLEKYVELTGEINATYIPNGVDTELFKREFVVGFVGMKADKGDHKGFKIVKQACDELGLTLLANEGQSFKHEEMFDFYNAIDCLVVMSKSEGCNNPTLEALAMNKPVISTDTGIARELAGVNVVARDKDALKQALLKQSGRIQILKEFTWKKIANRYRELYVRFLGE